MTADVTADVTATAIAVAVAVLLAAGVALALVRIVRGPSTLDRIVATDVLLAITAGAIAAEAAYTRDATGLPILLGLALLGAVGSVAVGRFADPAARVPGPAPGHDERPEGPPAGPASGR
jgi:multicomponent Na+:H+ antiporter subunit F